MNKHFRIIEYKPFEGAIYTCFRIEKLENDIWIGLAFRLEKEKAYQLAEEWEKEHIHCLNVKHRISWRYNSEFSLNRRHEIDKWYNSLSKKERNYLDDIMRNSYLEGYLSEDHN